MRSSTVGLEEKLEVLATQSEYDLSCACGEVNYRPSRPMDKWLYPAVLPNGKRTVILKVLLNNRCSRSCLYCAQRRERDFAPYSFAPNELAKTFIELADKRRVFGLFLSSAIPNSAQETMDEMLATVEIIRLKYRYRGFIHLKVLPGSTFGQVAHGAQLANRLSINLEAPTAKRLKAICPQKDLKRHIVKRMSWIKDLTSQGVSLCKGQTTQFVVGATDETDQELLSTTNYLYGNLKLSRVYFSAFRPVLDTPLADKKPTLPLREHRLYQADFLFRRYGFRLDELGFSKDGNLPLAQDPKMVWTKQHPEFFPVEVNKASVYELLRVPGIGPISAKRIVNWRLKNRLTSVADLKHTGALVSRALPYILIAGRSPISPSLF